MYIVMSSRNTNSKTNNKKQPVEQVVAVVAPVNVQVEEKKQTKSKNKKVEDVQNVENKVVETEQQTQPATKDNKKSKSVKKEVVQEVAQEVVQEVVQEVAATSESVKSSKKSKDTKSLKTPVPVQETVQEPVATTKSVKSSKKSKDTNSLKTPETVQVVEAVQTVPELTQDKKSTRKQKVNKEDNEHVVELEQDNVETDGGKNRYFKLFYNEKYQGRYRGRKPKQAANKAFSSIIKDMKKNHGEQGVDGVVNVDINFSIRECTRNSKHKEYSYTGIRKALNEPLRVPIKKNDESIKEIVYNFHNKIQKAARA